MTKINTSPDCGNSPKNRLLLTLTIAMARGDETAARERITDSVEWRAVGRRPVVGADEFCKAFSRYAPASTLTIDHVISHGRAGAVNGIIAFGEKRRAFCHVYEFSNARGAKVSSLTSYSLPLK